MKIVTDVLGGGGLFVFFFLLSSIFVWAVNLNKDHPSNGLILIFGFRTRPQISR